jgi:hypothetical protein
MPDKLNAKPFQNLYWRLLSQNPFGAERDGFGF